MMVMFIVVCIWPLVLLAAPLEERQVLFIVLCVKVPLFLVLDASIGLYQVPHSARNTDPGLMQRRPQICQRIPLRENMKRSFPVQTPHIAKRWYCLDKLKIPFECNLSQPWMVMPFMEGKAYPRNLSILAMIAIAPRCCTVLAQALLIVVSCVLRVQSAIRCTVTNTFLVGSSVLEMVEVG
jgi:hypothetical protein